MHVFSLATLATCVALVPVASGPAEAGEEGEARQVIARMSPSDLGPGWRVQGKIHVAGHEDSAYVTLQSHTPEDTQSSASLRAWKTPAVEMAAEHYAYNRSEEERALARARGNGLEATLRDLPAVSASAYVRTIAKDWEVSHGAQAYAAVGRWVVSVTLRAAHRRYSVAQADGLAARLLALLVERSKLGAQAERAPTYLPASSPGEPVATGIVPGDVVLGNIANFPGHAGIYIGKWSALPEELQGEFAHVRESVLIRSRNPALAKSFLVVDSDGGRGVRLASFVEQFTGYLPKGRKEPNYRGALEWESATGGAVAWPGLGPDDPRRWRIVREALLAAAARVPYDDSHLQRETTSSDAAGSPSYWSGRVAELRSGPKPYSEMTGLDCIALVHVAYWRGAGIDLDVSMLPWHTPGQLHETMQARQLARSVRFDDVYLEGLLNGVWSTTVRGAGQSGAPLELRVYFEVHDGKPMQAAADAATGLPTGPLKVLQYSVREVLADGSLRFAHEDANQSSELVFRPDGTQGGSWGLGPREQRTTSALEGHKVLAPAPGAQR